MANRHEHASNTTQAALSKAERDIVIDTGRHVYGCCADDCEYHGLPEDAQIRAVERILAERIAEARREGAASLLAEAEWLETAHANSADKGYPHQYREGFRVAAGWVRAHAEHGQTWLLNG